MRIPYDVVRDGLSAINRAAENMAAAERQVSTGRRISGVGDDPLAAQQAIAEHAALGAIDAYSSSLGSASARLASADAIFTSLGDKLGAVIVAGLSARGSSTTAAARSAAADAVRGLRDSLLADLNSDFNGSAVFAGTEAGVAAYAQVGGAWVYQGNASTLQTEVEHGRLVSVTFDGQAIAQGSDTTDVFTVLDQLEAAIRAGDDTAIGTAVAGIERAFDRTLRAQGSLGAAERGLDDSTLRLATLKRATELRRVSLEDANMAEAVTRLTAAQTGYQAALAAVSSIEKVSLLDYLR